MAMKEKMPASPEPRLWSVMLGIEDRFEWPPMPEWDEEVGPRVRDAYEKLVVAGRENAPQANGARSQ